MDAFLQIAGKPDNVFALAALPVFAALLFLWMRTAIRNDRLLRDGGEEAVRAAMERPSPDGHGEGERIHSWPYLVRVELLVALAVMAALTVLSILVDAPLEQIADPARTPNPSKAPWYFLGLQELLVYFDPWIAGVAFPVLIVLGLAIVPYVDRNPRGNGFAAWRERRFAISTFLFGFVGLWLALIIVGTFCRGPGWAWFWPWEPWDAHRAVNLPTRDWPQLFGVPPGAAASALGGLTVAAYYGTAFLFWRANRARAAVAQLGAVRFVVVAFLFLTMLAVPIKMALRLVLSVKYVWTTPWFNV